MMGPTETPKIDLSKNPWTFWNECVKHFDLENLGAGDGEPRERFASIVRGALEGRPYPKFAFIEGKVGDLAMWELYGPDEDKGLGVEAWKAKVQPFDDLMRTYHAAVSEAAAVINKIKSFVEW